MWYHVVNVILVFTECPAGFFMSDGSPQCFKFFPEKRGNWRTANETCAKEGLMMALPTDAVAIALRKDLLYTYGKQLFLYLITTK